MGEMYGQPLMGNIFLGKTPLKALLNWIRPSDENKSYTIMQRLSQIRINRRQMVMDHNLNDTLVYRKISTIPATVVTEAFASDLY